MRQIYKSAGGGHIIQNYTFENVSGGAQPISEGAVPPMPPVVTGLFGHV